MFLLVIKAGSLPGEAAFKDGMPVTILPADELLSPHMLKTFVNVRLDDSLKPDVVDAMKNLMDSSGSKMLRCTSGYLDLGELAELLDKPSLVYGWRGPDVVPIQDGTHIKKDDLNWYETENERWVDGDPNAVTTGSYTVGSGGDYANWNAVMADIASLTGDLTFTQTSNTTETTAASTGAIALNGYTLTFTNQSSPDGDPTAGYTSTLDPAGAGIRAIDASVTGTGSCVVEKLNIKSAVAGLTSGSYGILVTTAGPDVQCHDCLVDVSNLTSSTTIHAVALFDNTGASASTDVNGWNLAITTSVASGTGFLMSATYTSVHVHENITVNKLGSAVGIDVGSGAITIRNCAVLGSSNCFVNTGTANGYNNASEDATAANGNWSTGSGNQTGITVANEFLSTDQTNTDYVKVTDLSGGVCYNGGATPAISGNTAGIRGNSRPHSPDVSIGADELEVTGTGSMGGRPAWAW